MERIYKIDYNDKTYWVTGLTKNPNVDIMVQMVIDGVSYRQIAKIFDCTHQNVEYHLRQQDLLGYISDMKELIRLDQIEIARNLVEQNTYSDGEISSQTSLPIHVVYGLRRKILPRYQQRNINPGQRLKSLCYSLFSNDYVPGPEFLSYISERIELIESERKREAMQKFYVNFCEVTNGYSRLIRHLTRDDILINENPQELIKQDVLCLRK